jgi:DNA-binding NarL/FixJ family response regulator
MCPTAIHDGRRTALGLPRSRQNPSRAGTVAIGLQQSTSAAVSPGSPGVGRARVQVWTENQLVREALCRVLSKHEGIDFVGTQPGASFDAARLAKDPADVLVFISRGSLAADTEQIGAVRAQAPGLKILLVGSAKEDAEFLQYLRAGISGYLWRNAAAEDIARGILNVHAGKAVCPGELCAALFRFFEDAEPRLPFGSPTQRLGFTRREQQIVPLIAKGFTNKEIANHFCLSEQTVKSHLYRMKHKIGAEDRLSIVRSFAIMDFCSRGSNGSIAQGRFV